MPGHGEDDCLGRWPLELARRLAGFAAAPIRIGRSGATVLRFDKPGAAARFLKHALAGTARSLAGEARRLDWMRTRGLPVAAVEALIEHDDREFLLLAAIDGANAAECAAPPLAVVEALAAGLRRLHDLDARGCPFDARAASEIEQACRRLAAGLVDERDFDAERLGRPAADLFHELLATRPAHEDLVFTHGDYCLPNVILRGTALAGFVDVGRAGIGDRYRDLALAHWSITHNLGAAWVAPFFAAYGIAAPDPAKLAFYRLLDEFF